MPWTVTDLCFGLLLPAGVTFAVLATVSLFVKRFSSCAADKNSKAESQSYFCVAPIALGAGFEAGYWSLTLGPPVPTAHWHWLPYAIALACAAGAVSAIFRRKLPIRGLLFLGCAVGIAFLLTPSWNDLQPARSVYLVVWPLLVTSTALGIDAWHQATQEQRRMEYAMVIAITFLSASLLLLLSDNLRFSHMAMTVFGAVVGLCLALLLPGGGNSPRDTSLAVAMGAWGLMLIGGVNTFSAIPLLSWLLIPLAPVGLWIGALPQIRDLPAAKRLAVSLGPPCLACAVAIGTAVWAVREIFE